MVPCLVAGLIAGADRQLGRWVPDAQVAEVRYTAFTSYKGQAITARLIVCRVKDLNRNAAADKASCSPPGTTTPSSPTPPFVTLQPEEQHRGHAQAEQIFVG